MPYIFKSLLFLHISAGSIALLSGFIAMIAPKWSSSHRISGRIFHFSTLSVAISAILMALMHGKTFMLHIGVFTFYQIHGGFQSVVNKRLLPSRFDRVVLFLNFLNGGLMLFQGNTVLIVFGLISLFLGIQDLHVYIRLHRKLKIDRYSWMRRHMGLMIGSYIAIFTAVLVVNSSGALWIWLGPTLGFTPLLVYWNIRLSRNHPPKAGKKWGMAFVVLLSWGISETLQAQPYVSGGNTRHRFAQMNFGVNSRISPTSHSSFYHHNSHQQLSNDDVGWHTANRLIIGGTHFWGHADFLVAFPIIQSQQSGYRERIESSFRYFPWRIESNKFRPYVGISHMATEYKYGDGPRMFHNRIPISAGVYYLKKDKILELGFTYHTHNLFEYPYSPHQSQQVKAYPFGFQLGFKWMFDGTVSAETNWKNGKTAYYTDTLAKLGRLDGFTLGFGPSASFFTAKSAGLANTAAWLYQHKSTMMAEIMAGYYWHKPDLQLSLVYRQLGSELEAYGSVHRLNRQALTLESYHFFTDFHGFAPYIGPALSMEFWQSSRSEAEISTEQSRHRMLSPGLSFGWDIRPDRLQRWYLRTALRYFPLMRFDAAGVGEMRVDQLEVNFIQLVIFPGRFR
ncbi:MAG: hypothetical protein ACK417_05595 [Bacteroidia bacterium]